MAARAFPPQASVFSDPTVAQSDSVTRPARGMQVQAERLMEQLLEMTREPSWELPQASCDAIEHLAGKVLGQPETSVGVEREILELAQSLSRERKAFEDYMKFRALLEAAGTPLATITRDTWLTAKRETHTAGQRGIVSRAVHALLRGAVFLAASCVARHSPRPASSLLKLGFRA